MPIVFMKRHRDFRAMYEWGEDADKGDLSAWENAFLHFLKKVMRVKMSCPYCLLLALMTSPNAISMPSKLQPAKPADEHCTHCLPSSTCSCLM